MYFPFQLSHKNSCDFLIPNCKQKQQKNTNRIKAFCPGASAARKVAGKEIKHFQVFFPNDCLQ